MSIETTELAGTATRTTDCDWTDLRRHTIGAHEVAALFESVAENADTGENHDAFETEDGAPVSAYNSPLALWEMKTGRYRLATSTPRSLWSRIKWGVINDACERRSLETRRPEGVFIHPDFDFISARIDAEASEDHGQSWVPLCAYNVPGTLMDTWRNATGDWTPPEYVHLQAQHHMAVLGSDRVFVVGFFGGKDTRFFTIERDDDLIAEIVEAIRDFWSCVADDRQPSHSGGRDSQVLNRLCARIDPETAIVDMRDDAEFLGLVERKSALSAQRSSLEKDIKALNAAIAKRMDNVGAAIIADTKQLAWTHTPEKEIAYTRPASSKLTTRKISDKSAGTAPADLARR